MTAPRLRLLVEPERNWVYIPIRYLASIVLEVNISEAQHANMPEMHTKCVYRSASSRRALHVLPNKFNCFFEARAMT